MKINVYEIGTRVRLNKDVQNDYYKFEEGEVGKVIETEIYESAEMVEAEFEGGQKLVTVVDNLEIITGFVEGDEVVFENRKYEVWGTSEDCVAIKRPGDYRLAKVGDLKLARNRFNLKTGDQVELVTGTTHRILGGGLDTSDQVYKYFTKNLEIDSLGIVWANQIKEITYLK
jgi:hypothetical protein